MSKTALETYPALQNEFALLEKLQQEYIQITAELFKARNGALYQMDLVLTGAMKRTLGLIDGMLLVVNNWNYTSAAALLRLHLDTLLKLHYLKERDFSNTIAQQFFVEDSVRNIKDKTIGKLTDRALIELAKISYPWISEVYKETSKIVHFSNKSFFNALSSPDDKDRTVGIAITAKNEDWGEKDIHNLLSAMIKISEEILLLLKLAIIKKKMG